MEDRLRLVQEVAHRWYLGALERRSARALAGAPWQGSRSQRRYCGLPDDQDHGVGGTERGFDPAKKVEGILSATCSSTPRVWCSKQRYTAPKSQTKMESGCCLTRRAIALGGFRTYGSTRATRGGAEDGPRRCWV